MFKTKIEVELACDMKVLIEKYRSKDMPLSMIFGTIDRHRVFIEMDEFFQQSLKIRKEQEQEREKAKSKAEAKGKTSKGVFIDEKATFGKPGIARTKGLSEVDESDICGHCDDKDNCESVPLDVDSSELDGDMYNDGEEEQEHL